MSCGKTTHDWRILVVDDAPNTRELLRRNLSNCGYDVLLAEGVQEAVRSLESERVDLVITDLKMPRISGMDLVKYVHENYRDTGVMMVTGYPTVEGAVEAMKRGAIEYLAKPFTDEELFDAVERALERIELRRTPVEMEEGDAPAMGLIGQSEALREVQRMILKAARSSANVLITGESGTGKELAARAIHYASERAQSVFVPVALAGVPETLVESTLFGHVRGAFTGATETRQGFFHAANGGTLFLDEISEIPLPIQVKLLRVLQEREFQMVGSTKTHRVDVRLLASTNRDLSRLVSNGQFREDLFFRVNVIPIQLPPLRERIEDIPLLVSHFAQRAAVQDDRSVPRFSGEVMDHFQRHSWPGNVRELENVVQQMVVMAEGGEVELPDLPEIMRYQVPQDDSDSMSLAEVELRHIRRVLESVGGNKSRAARLLGIDRKTLREKLKQAEERSSRETG